MDGGEDGGQDWLANASMHMAQSQRVGGIQGTRLARDFAWLASGFPGLG